MDFKKYLTEDVLDFWLSYAIDEKEGGIFTQLERDGKIYGYEKSVWFQGRALWTFSKAYNYIEKDCRYLDAARKIYEFLPRCTDTDGRMFFTVTREGKPIQKRRYYFSETFAAIGCAQYSLASGDSGAWESAERYYETAYYCYTHPQTNAPKTNIAARAHSPVMIMIATSRSMAECAPSDELRWKYSARAREFTEYFLRGGFVNRELGALLETVAPDGSFMDTPVGRQLNPGHALETAWFLMAEGLIENNTEALKTAKYIIDVTMPRGLDREHGGIISFADVLGKPAGALEWDMKLWWGQNEAIIANRMAYEIFGEEKYKRDYEMLLDYALTHFRDEECGEWYGYLHYDSTPSTDLKGNIFKGPFHLPRMLMLLDKIDQGEMLSFFGARKT